LTANRFQAKVAQDAGSKNRFPAGQEKQVKKKGSIQYLPGDNQ
jgi:hypothetical protein